jgi:hypothetical protein
MKHSKLSPPSDCYFSLYHLLLCHSYFSWPGNNGHIKIDSRRKKKYMVKYGRKRRGQAERRERHGKKEKGPVLT